jgi:hypothetical protein
MGTGDGDAEPERAPPHLPQKFEVGALSAPQFMQRRTNAFPQRAQKLFPAGFPDPPFSSEQIRHWSIQG